MADKLPAPAVTPSSSNSTNNASSVPASIADIPKAISQMELPDGLKPMAEQLATEMFKFSKKSNGENYGPLLWQLYDVAKNLSQAKDEGRITSLKEQLTGLNRAALLDLTKQWAD